MVLDLCDFIVSIVCQILVMKTPLSSISTRSGSHSSLGQGSKDSTPSSGHGSTPSGYSTGRDISSTPESSSGEYKFLVTSVHTVTLKNHP